MGLTYYNILVAVDGSEESDKALQKAISVAKRNDAKLSIAHIIDTRAFATVEAYDRTVAERAEKFASEILNKYKQMAKDAGITNLETIVDFGSPKVKLAKDIAVDLKIDLIVCGATGLNAVERLFIGSVSESIARYAKCDVLIVRSQE